MHLVPANAYIASQMKKIKKDADQRLELIRKINEIRPGDISEKYWKPDNVFVSIDGGGSPHSESFDLNKEELDTLINETIWYLSRWC